MSSENREGGGEGGGGRGLEPSANFVCLRACLGFVGCLKSRQVPNRNYTKIEIEWKWKYDLKKYFLN